MYSSKDLERLWFLFKTEGEPKGVSINSFCVSNNVPYTVFYDWYKKTQKKAVPVEVVGVPTATEHEEPSQAPLRDELNLLPNREVALWLPSRYVKVCVSRRKA